MPSSYNLLKVFISYSHQDSKYLKRLLAHLITLERNGMIDTWSDTKIVSGANWRDEISQAIDSAKVAVLLISADYLASQFIAENELPPLLGAAKTKGTVILPVILSPCDFESSNLSQFQVVNSLSNSLSKMNRHQKEELWTKVTTIIRETITARESSENTDSSLSQNGQKPYTDIYKKELSNESTIRDTKPHPVSLPHFEDRVLYHLVALTGHLPLPLGSGISEADLAERLANELGIPPDLPRSPQFHSSDVRGTILAAVTTLEQEGLLEAIKVFGPWTIRPTLAGRRSVEQWNEAWRKSQLETQNTSTSANPDFKILTSPTFQPTAQNWIDVNAHEQCIEIKNIGKENAYYIYAVLFGCETYIVPQTMPQKRMDGLNSFHWREHSSCPLEPGDRLTLALMLRRDKLNGNQKIGNSQLYAPQEPSLYDVMHNPDLPFHSARLTLTFRDRFGNKYAQTFDYDHNRRSWMYLSHPTIIAEDFFDLLGGIT